MRIYLSAAGTRDPKTPGAMWKLDEPTIRQWEKMLRALGHSVTTPIGCEKSSTKNTFAERINVLAGCDALVIISPGTPRFGEMLPIDINAEVAFAQAVEMRIYRTPEELLEKLRNDQEAAAEAK